MTLLENFHVAAVPKVEFIFYKAFRKNGKKIQTISREMREEIEEEKLLCVNPIFHLNSKQVANRYIISFLEIVNWMNFNDRMTETTIKENKIVSVKGSKNEPQLIKNQGKLKHISK